MVVYFHGGGWVIGDLDSDDPICRSLAELTGAVVVSVTYRHAPEDPFPPVEDAPVEDAHAALVGVAEHAAELGGDRPGWPWPAGRPGATWPR